MDISDNKILIANRGEIAVRIMQACQKLGVEFVCVYTAEDAASGHVALAKKLGGEKSLYRIASYHDANELLAVGDEAGATAIHPGYGFFAEDYRFARRVTLRNRGMIFLGPSWRVIRELGDKINTKRLARSLGVPTVPGSDRPIYDELEAEELAYNLFDYQMENKIDPPLVLVKASAGGGGMGIEEVYDLDLFRQVYRRIRNYAARQFKDEGVLIEQRIRDFNHLEVQILADRNCKNVVHFGTRNCSIQSTGLQKRVEIAPGFDPANIKYQFDAQKVLDDIISHSLAMAREVKYDSVGTWEWIVTRAGNPYLMEVNTRIQVENGVSAMIARIHNHPGGQDGVDLIAEQIRTGLGDPLGYEQKDISFEGMGIEYRIIAEAPENNFTPWVGRIDKFAWPAPEVAPWLKMHTHVPTDKAYDIPTEFDPNLALGIVWGKDIDEVKKRGVEFLKAVTLEGKDAQGGNMKSNLAFLEKKTADILKF